MSDTAKRAAPEAKVKAEAEAEADQTAPEAGVKQGEPELVTEAPTAQDDGDHAKQDMDEMKRKFREALDRKNQVHAEGQSTGGQDTGTQSGRRSLGRSAMIRVSWPYVRAENTAPRRWFSSSRVSRPAT